MITAISNVYFNVDIFHFYPSLESKIFFTVTLIMGIGMIILFVGKILPQDEFSIASYDMIEPTLSEIPFPQPTTDGSTPETTPDQLPTSIQNIKQVYRDLKLTPIITYEDTIYRAISDDVVLYRNQEKWRTYLPISISLLATIIVVKFDDTWTKFFLTGSQWFAVFLVILSILVLYTSYLIIYGYAKRVTLNDLMEKIRQKSL